jgi:hypothetical protein
MSLGEIKSALTRLAGLASSGAKLIDAGSEIHRALAGTDPVGTLPGPPQVTLLRQAPGAPLRKDMIPVRTLEERVAIVAGQVVEGRTNPAVIESARAVVAKQCKQPGGKTGWCIPPHDALAEIQAIFYAVRDRLVRYTSDPIGTDMFASARASLKTKAGDCAQQTVAMGAHLGAIGHPYELVCVQEKGEPDYSHIFGRTAYVDKAGVLQVVTVDAAVQEPPGWEVPDSWIVKRVCFEVPG